MAFQPRFTAPAKRGDATVPGTRRRHAGYAHTIMSHYYSLPRVLVAVSASVLVVGIAPAAVIVERRLAQLLRERAQEELAAAPRLLADRQAMNADAMTMHAKELALAPSLAVVMAAGDSGGAVRIAERARGGYGDAAVLSAGENRRWSGPALPDALLADTRHGRLPVSVLHTDGALRMVAVAPVMHTRRWVGAAGIAIALDQSEAERLAGLSRADVLLLANARLVAAAPSRPPHGLAAAGRSLPTDGRPRELVVDSTAYLAVAAALGDGARAVFVRALHRELAVLPRLRAVSIGVGGLALLVALALGALLARWVARPVQALARAADRVAAGDFASPIPATRIGELQRLAAAFIAMREALVARLAEIETRQARLAALQSELMQQDRLAAAGRLVLLLAHEIRNPVGGIRNCLELIRRRQAPDDEAQRYAQLALDELLRLDALVTQVLDMHRPSSGARVSCHARGVVEDVAALLRLEREDASARMAVSGDTSAEAAITTDALKQILLNLGRNALEATGGAADVSFVVEAEPERVRITVADSGPGLAPDVLPRVFDPFFTTKRAVRGVGLGLFVAEGLVRAVGGSIAAANRADRTGAVFTVLLPRAAALALDADELRGLSPHLSAAH
jgi:signal transduction histidine kinase